MRKLILLQLLCIVAAGCATQKHSHSPSRYEQDFITINTLYEQTRVWDTNSGGVTSVFVPDTALIQAAENILQRYSQHEEPSVRSAAAYRLAKFGTKSAFTRALEIAQTEPSPEIRADLWSTMCELIQNPLHPSPPDITPISNQSSEESASGILLNPSILLIIHSPFNQSPRDFILPQEISVEDIESEIIQHYASDSGAWQIIVTDRVPFLPFLTSRRSKTLTVRQSIAMALLESAQGNTRILEAFRAFSQDPDESVSGPAHELVERLSPAAGP